MLTRCPACQTLFRIRAETLRVAQGRVRCGRCGNEFNALDSLAEDPDDLNGAEAATRAALEEGHQAPAETPQPAVATGDVSVTRASQDEPVREPVSDRAAQDESDREPATHRPAEDFVGPLPEAAAAQAPEDFVGPLPEGAVAASGDTAGATPPIAPELIHALLLEDAPQHGRTGPRLLAGLAAMLLLATLAGQWLYLQRAPLYDAYPPLRPVLERLCLQLDCALPLARAPERIEIVQRIVREHPRVSGALLVDLTFVSRAEGRIAYPLLELRLADLSGNRVAARRFTPAEYLPQSDNSVAGLAANAPVQVSLELLAPNLDVVSFQFDFL